jgi:hypothetical protein
MANGLGIERGRTVQASVNTGASNPYEAYQQMADTLKEADTDLSGSKVSAYEKSEALGGDDDSDNKTSTVTYYDDNKKESDTLSIKEEDSVLPLKDKEGKTIGAVDISKGAVDLYAKDEGLYKGLDISFSDKKFGVPIGGLTYEDTPSGRKGLTFELGKGKIYTDADVDLLDFENTPVKANLGFVLDFAKGGFVPDTKPMQMEMDLILSETKDPVSGNTAPLGATPEEVRDDVPINASPNEFMINAATRRYYGTDFFEELQKSAAEGWERIKRGEESYFRDDELEVEDDEKGQDKPRMGMDEGGPIPEREIPPPVGGGYGGYGGTGILFSGFELRTFADPNNPNRTMKIAFFNGRPITRIPKDFVESDVETADDTPVQTTTQGDTRDRRELGYELKTNYREKDISDWSSFDYGQYYSDVQPDVAAGKNIAKLTNAEKGITYGVGFALTGSFAGAIGLNRLAEKSKYDTAVKVFNKTKDLMKKGGLEEEFGKTVAYTNYMLGKSLGFFEERDGKLYEGENVVVEPEKPDISIIKRYKDKPTSGMQFIPGQSIFKSQYDRMEALQGTFGNKARYLASQEIHSQGLRARGLEDTSVFGRPVGPIEAITDLATQGYIGDTPPDSSDDNGDDYKSPAQIASEQRQSGSEGSTAQNTTVESAAETASSVVDAAVEEEKDDDENTPPSYDYGGSGPFHKGGLI